ncbi:MAG: PAS domain-containing sensor histidine kinase [Bradyrhizobium sp.]|uniref:hybrid sensor histidine kinase/response regulator n=1 Tax=Bradyrhizobium sp. TaxID=376 RepID=UPI00121383B9|nr:PAS domain-containing sensor histidine kinase [Bradyrhizobium sp.]THD65077.1 MAG: PAS domain-containing sensor histidine kinase [Bradyrhizobium sp.]
MAGSKKLERNLYESERNFRLLVEGITDYAIYMLDPEGHVANWNKGAERIKGYKAKEIVGQHFSRFYTPEDRAAGRPRKALETARKEKHFLAEGWRVRKDGTRFFASVVIDPIYEKRRLVGFAKITRDITERQNALTELLKSESQFKTLVGGVTDYALYMLDPNGIVANWNAGGERIKGYSAAEIVGQHFSRFYTPVDQAAGKPARALGIAVETGHYEEEGWRVRKDGSFFWASVVIDPIRNDAGELIGFAKITRDISERKAAEERLSAMQRQLAESQKFDALGQLTGGVAHDFNNLLMIISGSIHAIRKEVAGEKALRALQSIDRASQRAASLTRQLLTFARRQSVQPQSIKLSERLESLRDVLSSGLGSAVSLTIDVADDVWNIVVDPGEFETALLNLVINARDAMPDGGTLTIAAKNLPDKNQVAISVEDTGVGIPDDIAAKVFDPFFTTKAVGKGTGLGLSQVHGFAHQAGGTIALKSVLGSGTTITMCLPKATTQAMNGKGQVSLKGSGTVLLVEDNPEVANVSTGLLEQLGYAVRWATNASAALAELEKDGIDIVFSDVVMPGKMDGIALAKTIRRKKPEIPILLVTGYSASTKEIGLQFPILRKPYQLHELSRELQKLALN